MLRDGDGRVTQIELFYDLVYVFAVTQLARLLVTHPTVDGALRTAVKGHPDERGNTATSWLVVGGVALFLAGHALFKYLVWGVVSWQRVAAVVVLLALLLLAPHVSALALGFATLAVVIAVAVADRVQRGALVA